MNPKNKMTLQSIFLGLSVLSIATGCGKAADTSVPAADPAAAAPVAVVSTVSPLGTCGSGPYTFTNPNCLTDFVTACGQIGTIVSTTPVQICRIHIGTISVTAQTGILNPNDPSGPLAGNGLVVRAGDVISFNGAGTWGTVNVSTGSIFFGIFNYSSTSYSCNKVDINGLSEGSTGTYQGYPAGLLGAVTGSSQVFTVGSSLNQYTINNAGVLHVGMNAQASLPGICGGFSGWLYITVR